MKNFIFFKLLMAFTILFSFSTLLAQQVIVEHSSGVSDNIIYKSIFDQENYTISEDGRTRKIYMPKQSSTHGATEKNNESQMATLSINLIDPNGDIDVVSTILVLDEDGNTYPGTWEGTNPITIEVPEGTYDIYTDFSVSGGFTNYIIIKELVDISTATTVDIDLAEATNYVSIDAYNENGTLLEPGIFDPNTGIPSTIFFERDIYFSPSNYRFGYLYHWDAAFEEEPVWNFYINDVSERYSVMQSFIGFFYDGNSNYFSKFDMLDGINQSVTLENNPSDWVLHQEKFQPSLLSSTEEVYPAFSATITHEGIAISGIAAYNALTPFDTEEGIKTYLNNPFDDSPIDILVSPGIADHIIVTPFGQEGFFIKGNLVVKDGNNITYGSGSHFISAPPSSSYFLGSSYYNTEDGRRILPFHPRFSFSALENPEIVQGKNVPVCVTGVTVAGTTRANYVGRYGELRDSDFFATDVELQQDGITIFSGNYIDDFINYELPQTGSLDLTFTNANVNVGDLSGTNTTRLLFDMNKDDFTPPTVQCLQFRNTDGEVTDHFTSGEEGFVRLAAGDFYFNPDSELFYEYNEGNELEFFYSLHNQEDWETLELTEYPEHFFMPAFGDYYETSLENVEVSVENSWFDVKIVSTDAAGNSQIQTISPAFHIEESLNTNEVTKTKGVVYPNPFSGELQVQLPENVKGDYLFEITDLMGRIVFSENRDTGTSNVFVWDDGSALSAGVYVLSILYEGNIVSKRIIKK